MIKNIFFVYMTLSLLQSYSVFADGATGTAKKFDAVDKTSNSNAGSNYAVVKLTGINIKRQDDWINPVFSSDSSSGYNIRILKYLPTLIVKNHHKIYSYAMIPEEPSIRKYFGTDLCTLVSDTEGRNPASVSYHTLLRHLTRMIFTGFNNTCACKEGFYPITSKANLQLEDKELPFNRTFNVIWKLTTNIDRSREDTSYVFEAGFNIQLPDAREKSSGGNNKVESNNGIAKLSGIGIGRQDEWINAVKDDKSSSGYNIKISINVPPLLIKNHYKIYSYVILPQQPAIPKYISGSDLCTLVSDKEGKGTAPVDYATLLRQLTQMLFTGFENACIGKKGNYPIASLARVQIDNKELQLERTFYLVLNVITNDDRFQERTRYIFQANFTIQLLDANGKFL